MRVAKSLFVVSSVFLLATAVSTRSEASALSCPSPLLPTQNNTYSVDTASRPIDCVWGNGNLATGNNDFLDGHGTNDIGNSLVPATEAAGNPELFNLTWSFLGSTNSWSNGPGTAITGLSFTNSSNTSTNFSIDAAAAGGFNAYALGIKDGSDPQWAVFLLNNNSLSGLASMTGGSFSHFALFGTNTGGGGQQQQTPVPEPASLMLLGTGLFLTASKVRNRMKNRS